MSGIVGGLTQSNSGTVFTYHADTFINIGKMRIGYLIQNLDGVADTGSVPGDNSNAAGRYVNYHTISYTGFAAAPWIYACVETDAHEPSFNCVNLGVSSTGATLKFQSGREIYIEGETIRMLLIGVAAR